MPFASAYFNFNLTFQFSVSSLPLVMSGFWLLPLVSCLCLPDCEKLLEGIDLIGGKLQLHLQLDSPFIASKWKKKVALGHGTQSVSQSPEPRATLHWTALGESKTSGLALHLALYEVVTLYVRETQSHVVASINEYEYRTFFNFSTNLLSNESCFGITVVYICLSVAVVWAHHLAACWDDGYWKPEVQLCSPLSSWSIEVA